ncbi:MAG TPA: 7,8-didemethyl-8-hydroxy-5-deazariboflavin synthase, partial [Rubrobacteraceae bacterium]|nr:7,8-didemethyl-8-hydroxy-5-deazariboflavin synthase [Rubrobacteraceae bacterium]
MKETRGYEALVEKAVEGRLERKAAYALARFAYSDPVPTMRAAAGVRDRLFGPRVSYSRKVFIPLTKLCRDNCGYCVFARAPRLGERAYLTPEEVLAVARAGAKA